MATPVGVLNPNARIKEYVNSLRRESVAQTAAAFSLAAFAERAASRYDMALTVIRGGLIVKGLMLAAEYERQLTKLAEYANEEAEVMS
jgi:hypothetical protein